ncbi:hypothetical protein VM1G_08286 [Cytospora mali]|uniref:Heterokaryon incompatibility domain-containing protein n=1 Tax=Cytospora mali TaxID=578113 RepID=A0A194W8E6_CYTMA|nr:hypothetical protein VM1G_08286 [Valsa mali]
MARANCTLHAILRANPSFFSQENDIAGFKQTALRLEVPPFNVLRRCAYEGCELCTVMTAMSDSGCLAAELSLNDLEKTPLHLSRAMLSYHQQITLYMGIDDLLPPKHFHRIPSPWKETLPPARFDYIPDQRELISCWVNNCVKNHPKCRAAQRGFRPTRLLQVNCFSGSKDVRLVEFGSNGKAVPYVALSHCWGPPSKRPIITTKENITSHIERIPSKVLSRTFRDAVDIVRELGQSYVWIDSLCIIQDDEEDWAREAALMADVYRESFCTISAHSSKDGDGGCRVDASDEAVDSLRYVDLDIGEYRIRLFETKTNEDKPSLQWDVEYGDDLYKFRPYGSCPLRTRAWTLQERELSVRAIHFSRSTLLWECLEMKGSTEVPHDVIRRYSEPLPLPLPAGELPCDISAVDQDHWYGMVEDYSSRFLTVESDKLPAMAGLAKNFQRDTLKNGTYLAGLWKEFFPGALLWRVRREHQLGMPGETHPLAVFQPRRPMRYRAPSWSWACLDGEITYASQRVTMTDEEPPKAPLSRIILERISLGVSDFYLFRAPRRASIVVHGQIIQATIRYTPSEPSEQDIFQRQLYSKDGDIIGFFYPDIMLEVQFLREISCLGVCDEVYGSTDHPTEVNVDEFGDRLMGLALLPAIDHPGAFRRIGLLRWLKKSMFEDAVSLNVNFI